jgi:WhiB family redox-sensing transcriptional regulator
MPFDQGSSGWQRLAACRGEDATYYFAPSYFEKRREKLAREAVAKRICAVCPVQQPCLEYALATREVHGVWGGLNETERRAILKRQALDARAS